MIRRDVPFFNYPAVFTSEEEDLVKIFRDVGRRGAFIMQKDLADFERQLAAYVGVRYAVGVGNATDGLYFALRAGGIRAGDEVIISSHTMIATAAAIHAAGAIPIPVEVGLDRMIDASSIQAAVGPRTRAIMPTQLNGRTCDMDVIASICARHGLLLFEDAAQALGSRWKGRFAGAFGIASAISFYPAKILGCLGDGGAVLTNDADVYQRVLRLRDFGRNEKGEIVEWALNSRLDNLQAAVLGYRLNKYQNVIDRRRAIAADYHERLSPISELDLPPGPSSQGADSDHFDVYQNYELVAERRDALRAFLAENGIGTLIQWGGRPVHSMRALGFAQELPKTDAFFRGCLMLPINMSLTDEDVAYVCDVIERFYRDDIR